MNMKKTIATLVMLLVAVVAMAQDSLAVDESQIPLTFKGKIVNDEYQVWISMDFYKKNVLVPDQELFGELPGYLGAKRDTRKWLIMDAEVEGEMAALTIINDYCSDDLTARLTRQADGTYLLEQLDGSPIRIVVNNKWVKLPKRLVFKPEKKAPK